MTHGMSFERSARARTLTAAVAAFFIAVPAIAQPQTCPPEGDATQALARELNPFKNRQDAPPVEKINPAATLSAVLAPGEDLNRWSRDSGAIFEGVVVGVKVGGIESVNCHAHDALHRDTHIELALDAGAPSRQRVIVEVTPHLRQEMAVIADWSTSALKKQLLNHRVRITGWMFDDLEHRPQAENSNPGGASNWRASVWEIHPVTGIVVLDQAANTASPEVGRATSNAPIRHHRRKHVRRARRHR